MKQFVAVVFALLFLSIAGAAQDVSLDKKLGAESAASVEQEMGIYHHDSLQALVERVGNRLVARLQKNPFEFKFFLGDSPEPNAFALPGGYVYVTRGILPLLQSEDELAGVMAHEIIHVIQRHSVKQMKKGMVTGILTLPGKAINVITGTSIGNVINVPIEFTTRAFTSRYSRGHESEADKFGIQLAASAGYKTDALADALERLSKEIELLTGERERHDYFSDHPYTPSRVTSIRKLAPQFPPVKPVPGLPREAFYARFNGLVYGPNPAQGIFDDSLFVQPDLKLSWVVPSGWITFNKPAAVGAYDSSGNAMINLRLAELKKTISETGEEAKAKASAEEGVQVLAGSDTTLYSHPAYVLRMRSIEKRDTAIVELVWIRFGEITLQLSGLAEPSLAPSMHVALNQVRKATPAELAGITIYRFTMDKAHEGETLESFSSRTGNHLPPDLTALFNDIPADQVPKAGTTLRIVTGTPYRPHH
jgi:predicted Zn-dependent protease